MGTFGNDFAVGQLFETYAKLKIRSDFVFIRLQNGTRIDNRFFEHWKGTEGIEIRVPYMNLVPWQSIEKQVLSFHTNVKKYAPDYSMVMLDIENNFLTPTMVSKAFNYSKSLFGNFPVPYSSQYYWKVGYPKLPKNLPKFVANYPTSLQVFRYTNPADMEYKVRKSMERGFPSLPPGWSLVDSEGRPNGFWQFTSTGVGVDWGLKYPDSKVIDVDYFPGNKDDLRNAVRRWRGETPIDPPPIDPPVEEEVVPIKEVITTVNLNVRSLPSTESKDIGTLINGTTIPIVSEQGEWYKISGYIHKGYTKDK